MTGAAAQRPARGDYVSALAGLRLARRESFARLIETVTAVDWDMDSLERQLNDMRQRFNRLRPAGRVRYRLSWYPSHRTSAGIVRHGVGMAALACDAHATPPSRRLKAWPRRNEIDRSTHPADRQYRHDVLDAIKAMNKLFVRDRQWLYLLGNMARKLATANELAVRPIDATRSDLSFEAASHYRSAISDYVVRVIKALLERMEELERELHEVMHEFNTVEPKRRNGSLSVAFIIRGTQLEKRIGASGPRISTVSFKNGRRYTHWLKTGSKRFPNRVTRDVIRERHLRRYAKPLLLNGRRIEQLRNKRWACQQDAERLHRHIRTMQRELT